MSNSDHVLSLIRADTVASTYLWHGAQVLGQSATGALDSDDGLPSKAWTQVRRGSHVSDGLAGSEVATRVTDHIRELASHISH